MKNHYTEEEAKYKWCPMVRGDKYSTILNRSNISHSFNCIGSDCMAWKWITEETGFCGLSDKRYLST